jgi:hypothetical protein
LPEKRPPVKNTCNEKRFPQVSLELTVRNEDPSENILRGTLFLTVISRGFLGNHVLLDVFILGAFFTTNS